jgi:hypothetical protein
MARGSKAASFLGHSESIPSVIDGDWWGFELQATLAPSGKCLSKYAALKQRHLYIQRKITA